MPGPDDIIPDYLFNNEPTHMLACMYCGAIYTFLPGRVEEGCVQCGCASMEDAIERIWDKCIKEYPDA